MYLVAFAFLIGCSLLNWVVELPNSATLIFSLLGIVTLCCANVTISRLTNFPDYFTWCSRLLIFVGVVLLGFTWGCYRSEQRLAWSVPKSNVISNPNLNNKGAIIELQGQVQGLPFSRNTYGIPSLYFDVKLDHTQALVRLLWSNPTQSLAPGDQLKVKAQLKAVHGFCNPGGFDSEKQALLKGVRAFGKVQFVEKTGRTSAFFQKLRFRLLQAIQQGLANKEANKKQVQSNNTGVITALIVGDTLGISPAQWQIFQKTGTSHLLAISGLHVSMVAGFVYGLSTWLWRRPYRGAARLHYWPAQWVGAGCAMMAAFIYSALAGWSIPTQRALVMVFIGMLGFQRQFSPWFLLSTALIAVLIIEPLATLTAGFWLSFLAVGSLIFSFSGWTHLEKQGLTRWIAPQWVIFIGLLPMGFLFFQQIALMGMVANFFAIPFVSFILLPITLMGGLLVLPSQILGHFFLSCAHALCAFLVWVLAWLAQFPSLFSQGYFTFTTFSLAIIGSILLLVPKGLPGRGCGAILFLPLLLAKAPAPTQPYQVWVSILEVGQGLSVFIQTKHHSLLYDTGPRLGQYDAGNKVIVPFLKKQNFNKLDKIVISHSDLDHRGGLASVLAVYQPDVLISSVPEKVPEKHSEPCYAGQHWQWDGVDFEMLSPQSERLSGELAKNNNRSCVLKISSGPNSLLLTGDIEGVVEKQLVNRMAEKLKSRIIIVPHHGSQGASTKEFVQAVQPEYAVFSAGYANQFGFPKAVIKARYEQMGAKTYVNSEQGCIQFKFDNQSTDLVPLLSRSNYQRFWQKMD